MNNKVQQQQTQAPAAPQAPKFQLTDITPSSFVKMNEFAELIVRIYPVMKKLDDGNETPVDNFYQLALKDEGGTPQYIKFNCGAKIPAGQKMRITPMNEGDMVEVVRAESPTQFVRADGTSDWDWNFRLSDEIELVFTPIRMQVAEPAGTTTTTGSTMTRKPQTAAATVAATLPF